MLIAKLRARPSINICTFFYVALLSHTNENNQLSLKVCCQSVKLHNPNQEILKDVSNVVRCKIHENEDSNGHRDMYKQIKSIRPPKDITDSSCFQSLSPIMLARTNDANACIQLLRNSLARSILGSVSFAPSETWNGKRRHPKHKEVTAGDRRRRPSAAWFLIQLLFCTTIWIRFRRGVSHTAIVNFGSLLCQQRFTHLGRNTWTFVRLTFQVYTIKFNFLQRLGCCAIEERRLNGMDMDLDLTMCVTIFLCVCVCALKENSQ